MNKFKLILLSIIVVVLTGCNSEMNAINRITKDISKSTVANEETINVEKLAHAVKENESPVTVELYENGTEVSISNISKYMESKLVVKVGFTNGSIFEWTPIDNNNIYILLRE
ncbi:MAG: hypothetical protein GY951_01560 [Psychromonas sp.]|nr:hypothetical protein [Alteromonadales bacterium]MCP5076735.1 hypothetical protein [Psychromonas sp.]